MVFSRFARRFTLLLPLIPSTLYLSFFIGYPLAQSLYWALTPSGGSGEMPLVAIVTSKRFLEVLGNTLLLVAVVVPLQFVLALAATLLFAESFRGKEIALYFFVLPLAVSDVAAALLWYTMLSPRGFLNKLLLELGVVSQPIQFFGYAFRHMEFLAIVLCEAWRATAIVFVNIYAGYQMIDRELIEASEVFGLSFAQRLRHIILPLLKPSIESALLIRTLFALQTFAPVLILAGLDIPVLATETFYVYAQLFDAPKASAWALLIGILTFIVSSVYVYILRTPEVR
uniref:Sugar ABC transporter permease n=1 Tax=Thermofilum pendens TaxID=2269 RepID=A0A7J3X844_THEPE